VHPEVVGVRVPALLLVVGDDDLRAVRTDGGDQPADGLVERACQNDAGFLLASLSGMPESR